MSRITRAAVAAALVTAAAPAAAEASTIEVFSGPSFGPHAFEFRAAPGETNDVRVSETTDGSTIVSDSAPIQISGGSSLDGCRLTGNADVVCAAQAIPVGFQLGDGNDTIRYQASEPVGRGSARSNGVIDGGAGNDTIFAGVRRNAFGVLEIFGGAGTADKVTYASAASPATVSLDGQGNDGVRGDAQNIMPDVEILEGSSFGDAITGSDADERERFIGGAGNDVINGLGGGDVFHEGPVPSGSDDLNGGSGTDLVDYSERTQGVLIDHDVSFDDGAPGENDLVDPNVNDIFGSQAADVITGSSGPNVIRGFGGGDTIRGAAGNDVLDGGTGADSLFGGADNDTLDTNDNVADKAMHCESGTADVLNRDLKDVEATGCEIVNSVGVLKLAPKAITAEAGKPAKVRMTWSHPKSWKQLRTVELRIEDAGKVVVRPAAKKLQDKGAVEVLRTSRLTVKGKKVTAHLALKLDKSLAGETLSVDVEATDVKGKRQLQRRAGTIRVS